MSQQSFIPITSSGVELQESAGGQYGFPATHFSILFAFLFVISMNRLTQDGKVTVIDPGSRELKRTARSLQVPPQQLKNTRLALQEATDLIKQMDPMPKPALGDLATRWGSWIPTRGRGAILAS